MPSAHPAPSPNVRHVAMGASLLLVVLGCWAGILLLGVELLQRGVPATGQPVLWADGE